MRTRKAALLLADARYGGVMSPLERDFTVAVRTALADIGFTKSVRGMYLWPLSEGVDGWLGLNLARDGLPKVLEIHATVGVRHHAAEKLELELRPDEGIKPPFATVARPLYLLNQARSKVLWSLQQVEDPALVVADLVDNVDRCGKPFILEYADLQRLLAAAFGSRPEEVGLGVHEERAYALPILAAVVGDLAKAKSVIFAQLEALGTADHMYAISYRKFAVRFRERFLEHSG